MQEATATVVDIPERVRVEVPPGAVSGANAVIKVGVVGDEKAFGAGMTLLSKVVNITLSNGTLTGKINISLYFDKTKLGSNQEPAAFYYDEKASKWVRLECMVDLYKGTVMFSVNHLTLFAVFAVDKEVPKPELVRFKDMAGHWAETTVAKLAGMGVISGYEDGTFRPDKTITRAEMV
ncbi:S-layer homology domain-containing protein, partial [Desulfovirgula thermocuniculi]|uniref:S-layer homology domain-containing protein n=1 Tax=Desulfovirgula thermocuniculi TaxID=348842 RepID=UPI00146FA37A